MPIREILKHEFEKRCKRNASYSLRSFARDLGFSAQRLSYILNGKRGISREAGVLVATKLALSPRETEKFLDQVDAEFARSDARKRSAQARVRQTGKVHHILDFERFKAVSHWYHFAILTLLETEEPFSSSAKIAKAIGITSVQSKFALERMMRLGMVRRDEDGRFRAQAGYFVGGGDVPNEAVKQFHEQALDLTRDSIRSVGLDERDTNFLFMAVDPSEFQEAKKMIREFREKFDQRFAGPETRSRQVYGFGIQFYRIGERK